MSIFWSYNDIIFATKLAVLAVLGLSSSWAVITISTFFVYIKYGMYKAMLVQLNTR